MITPKLDSVPILFPIDPIIDYILPQSHQNFPLLTSRLRLFSTVPLGSRFLRIEVKSSILKRNLGLSSVVYINLQKLQNLSHIDRHNKENDRNEEFYSKDRKSTRLNSSHAN